MKIKIRFGEEARFELPNPQVIRNCGQWLPPRRLSLRKLAMLELPKPVKWRAD